MAHKRRRCNSNVCARSLPAEQKKGLLMQRAPLHVIPAVTFLSTSTLYKQLKRQSLPRHTGEVIPNRVQVDEGNGRAINVPTPAEFDIYSQGLHVSQCLRRSTLVHSAHTEAAPTYVDGQKVVPDFYSIFKH